MWIKLRRFLIAFQNATGCARRLAFSIDHQQKLFLPVFGSQTVWGEDTGGILIDENLADARVYFFAEQAAICSDFRLQTQPLER